MAKYIEREELVNRINKYTELTDLETQEWIKDECIRHIYAMPAADVVEIKHAEWVSVEADVIFACSNCEAEISTSWDYENDGMFSFCPCCGAKMDGERKNLQE